MYLNIGCIPAVLHHMNSLAHFPRHSKKGCKFVLKKTSYGIYCSSANLSKCTHILPGEQSWSANNSVLLLATLVTLVLNYKQKKFIDVWIRHRITPRYLFRFAYNWADHEWDLGHFYIVWWPSRSNDNVVHGKNITWFVKMKKNIFPE